MKRLLTALALLAPAFAWGQTVEECRTRDRDANCLIEPLIKASPGAYVDDALNRGVVQDVDTDDATKITVHRISDDGTVETKEWTAPDLTALVHPDTDLSVRRSASSVTVLSSRGNDAQVGAATPTQAGVMSGADKGKLNLYPGAVCPSGQALRANPGGSAFVCLTPPLRAPADGSVTRAKLGTTLRESIDRKAFVDTGSFEYDRSTRLLSVFSLGGASLDIDLPIACEQRPANASTAGSLTHDGRGRCSWTPRVAPPPTNLDYTASPSGGTVTSSTGHDAAVPLATGTNAGLLAPGDRTRLRRIPAADCSAGQVWKRGATAWACGVDSEGTGTTNLGYLAGASGGTITSSTGSNASVPLATGTTAGLLAPAEKGRIPSATCSAGQVWKRTGSGWACGADATGGSGGGGATDLGYTPGTASGTITSSTGRDATVPLATGTNAGLFSPGEKAKVARIPAGDCSTGEVWKRGAGGWSCQPDATGSGAGTTNLGYTAAPGGGTVTSSTGTDADLPLATGTNAGLLSPAIRGKADRIPATDCTRGQIWKRGTSTWTCAGDDTSDLTEIEGRVTELEETEDGLRTDTILVRSSRIVPSLNNTAYALGGTALTSPSDERDHEIVVSVLEQGNTAPFVHRFDLAELLAKPRVVADGRSLTATNGEVVPTDGSERYFYGIDSTGDHFIGVSGGSGAAVVVTVEDKRLDILSAARRSATGASAVFDADRLGTGTADATTVLYGDSVWRTAPTGGGQGVGLSPSQVNALADARVVAGTLPQARAGNTDRWGASKLQAVSRTQDGILGNNDYVKLIGIETGATADQTGTEIVSLITALSGSGRLSASALRDLPAAGSTTWTGLTDTPSALVADRWIQVNATGDKLELVAAPPVPNATIDARIGPAFRDGRLTGATIEQMQGIVDSFDGGGWADVSGALDSVPTVGGTLADGTQYNPTSVQAAPWGLTGRVGTRHQSAYIRIRIPVAYGFPLSQLRLLVGQQSTDPFVDPDDVPDLQTFDLGTSQIVTHLTTTATYSFYSVGPFDKPAGQGWRVQRVTPWELDRTRIGGDELVPPSDTDQNDQILRVVGGDPAWSVETPATELGERDVANGTITYRLGRGTSADVFDTAPTAFATDFDMTAAGQTHGRFIYDATCTITPPATSPDVNMAFYQGVSNATARDRMRQQDRSVLISEVRSLSDFVYTTTEAINGRVALRFRVWSGSTDIGSVYILAVKQGNFARWYAHWDGESGATNPTIGCSLEIDFISHDTAASPSTVTDLGYTAAPGGGTVTSSTGTDASLPLADATNAGLLSPTERTRLLRIPSGDCSSGQVWKRGASVWACAADANTQAATNLSASTSRNAITITSSTGTNATIPLGGLFNAGLVASGERTRFLRIPVADCSSGQVWKRGATVWACAADATSSGAGTTNLGYTASASGGTVTSSSGTDATLPLATATNAGLFSPSERTKVGRLPAADCSSGQVWKRGASVWACAADATGGTGGGTGGLAADSTTATFTPFTPSPITSSSGWHRSLVSAWTPRPLNAALVSSLDRRLITPSGLWKIEYEHENQADHAWHVFVDDQVGDSKVPISITVDGATLTPSTGASTASGQGKFYQFIGTATGIPTASDLDVQIGVGYSDGTQEHFATGSLSFGDLSNTPHAYPLVRSLLVNTGGSGSTSSQMHWDALATTAEMTAGTANKVPDAAKVKAYVDANAGSGGGGDTDLGYTASASGGTVTSSTGDNASLPLATGTNAGLLSPTERTRFLRIPSGDCTSGQVWKRGASVWACAADDDTVAPSATERSAGLVELATTADMSTGTAGVVPDAAKVKAYVDAEAVTNLTYTVGVNTGTVNSSTGTNATIPRGTTTMSGLMGPNDKTKLNRLPITDCTDGQVWKRGTTSWACSADATGASVPASESSAGIVELATTADMTSGTAGVVPDAAKVKAYVDGQVGSAGAGTARGRKVATSSVLPTAARTQGSSLTSGFTWTFDTTSGIPIAGMNGVPTQGESQVGKYVQAPASVSVRIQPPANPPLPSVIGLWFVSKVGTEERHAVWLPWGGAPLTSDTTSTDHGKVNLLFDSISVRQASPQPTTAYLSLQWEFLAGTGRSIIRVYGEGTVLPANSTIEVYEVSVGGAGGSGGGTASPSIPPSQKSISLGANATTGLTAGSTVTETAWKDVNLVADATAVGGVTASATAINFANAGLALITISLESDFESGGGGARGYNNYRGTLTRASVETMALDQRSPTCYTKTAVAGDLQQGPPRQVCTVTWTHIAQAGDAFGLEWQSFIQGTGTSIVAADSTIKVVMTGTRTPSPQLPGGETILTSTSSTVGPTTNATIALVDMPAEKELRDYDVIRVEFVSGRRHGSALFYPPYIVNIGTAPPAQTTSVMTFTHISGNLWRSATSLTSLTAAVPMAPPPQGRAARFAVAAIAPTGFWRVEYDGHAWRVYVLNRVSNPQSFHVGGHTLTNPTGGSGSGTAANWAFTDGVTSTFAPTGSNRDVSIGITYTDGTRQMFAYPGPAELSRDGSEAYPFGEGGSALIAGYRSDGAVNPQGIAANRRNLYLRNAGDSSIVIHRVVGW